MKARDSHPHFDSKVRESTNFAIREIKKICKEIGPRPSGEEGERKAQDYVENLMTPIADEVKREKFEVHPVAFMSWVLIDGISLLVAAILMILSLTGVIGDSLSFVFRCIATALGVACLSFLFFEFLLYKQMLDPFFPKRESSNVICSYKPSGEIKKRIIFAGHIDSAYEWWYTHLGGGKMLVSVIVYAIGSLVLSLVIDIISFTGLAEVGAVRIAMIVVQALTIPAFMLVTKFVNWKLCVTGANDNLTGVFASMAVVKYLKDNDIRFEHTEVVAMATGCEESGLRGAKAFAKTHSAEFAAEDTETVVVAVDTLHDFEYMGVYNKDMTGTVKLDPQVSAMAKKASSIAGYDIPYANVFFGSSDAAAFQQGKIKACALAAMDPTPARYYHTREDVAEILDMKTMEAGVKIMLETAFLYDEQGLKDEY